MSLRHQRQKADDEDAAQLKFGPEFSGEVQEGCLVISEVKLLLENRERKTDNPVFKKTFDYVSTFARFQDAETMHSVRTIFKDSNLAAFEIVQIANLCPATAEEAKALIPSLAGRDDDMLQSHLSELASLRRFAV